MGQFSKPAFDDGKLSFSKAPVWSSCHRVIQEGRKNKSWTLWKSGTWSSRKPRGVHSNRRSCCLSKHEPNTASCPWGWLSPQRQNVPRVMKMWRNQNLGALPVGVYYLYLFIYIFVLLYCFVLFLLWSLKWKTVWQFLQKLTTESPYYPAVPLIRTDPPKELKAGIHADAAQTPTFIIVGFTVAKSWKQTKCPSTRKEISQMWYTNTTKYCSVFKIEDMLTCAATWLWSLRMFCRVDKASHEGTNIVWFFLYEVCRAGTLNRGRKEKRPPQGLRARGNGSYCWMGAKLLFGKMRKFWKQMVMIVVQHHEGT